MSAPNLPIPGSITAPNFKGKNITKFIDKWERLYNVCKVIDEDKIELMSIYVDLDYRDAFEMIVKAYGKD